MNDDLADHLDLLYAFLAGVSVTALASIGVFAGLGGLMCR
jgi:hypothetical protein